MGELIKKFIVPGFPLFVIALLAVFVGVVQLMVKATIDRNTKVGQVSCVAVGYQIGTENCINAELTCDGKPGFHGDAQTTLVFIRKPGPHTCTLFESKRAKCD